MWAITWSGPALRDVEKLDRAVAKRLLAKIEAAAKDPPRHFRRLVGEDEHRMRVGDWRVIAALSPPDQILLILRVEHRSRVYR